MSILVRERVPYALRKIATQSTLTPNFSFRDLANMAANTGFREPIVDAIFVEVNGQLTVTATNGDLLQHEWWNILNQVDFLVNDQDHRIRSVDGETLYLVHQMLHGVENTPVLTNIDSTSTDINAKRFIDDSGSAVDWRCFFPIFLAGDTLRTARGRDWGINARNFTGSGRLSLQLRAIEDTAIAASPEVSLWAAFREPRGPEDGVKWMIWEQNVDKSRPDLSINGELHGLAIARYTDTGGVRDRREHLVTATDFSLDLASVYTTIQSDRLSKTLLEDTDTWLTARENQHRAYKGRSDWNPDYFAANYWLPLVMPGENQRRTDLYYAPGSLIMDLGANFTSTDKFVVVAGTVTPDKNLQAVTAQIGDSTAAVDDFYRRARNKGTNTSKAQVVQEVRDLTYSRIGPYVLDFDESKV